MNQSIEGYLYQHQIVPRAVYHVDGMIPLLLTIGSGQGFSLVPSCLQNLGIPGVSFKELRPTAPPLEVSLVWLSENKSPLLIAFVDFVMKKGQTLI